jgi:hypothetical protein
MAGVQQNRPRLFLADPAPHTRSVGVSVALLIAVFAAIAFFWNVSQRRAGHSPIAPPIARAEPLATPPISEASNTGADPPPAAEVRPVTPMPSAAAPSEERAADEPGAAAAEEQTPSEPALSAREQSQLASVINDGRGGLQTCYERALVRDPTLVRGNLKVRVAVTASGHPRRVSVRGPSAFREKMTPCLETAVSNWRFPAASAAYEAQFPLVLRGAE